MQHVAKDIFVGDDSSCRDRERDDFAVVHACKHPCHQAAVGYSGNLPQSHPQYLVYETERDLYLNLVDMDRPQQHQYMQPIVEATFEFIDNHLSDGRVLIHCNQGRSRSPTLALLYLAKRTDVLPSTDYQTAKQAFNQLYPKYEPAGGFESYLPRYWNELP